MNQDLTVGKPEIVLWKFCTPLFGSILFQQLYNIADSFVAGKFIGEEALAAVGNSYAFVLEFKVRDPEDEAALADTVSAALRQIEEKAYDMELVARGIFPERIRHYGFAFEGKTVLIG